MKKKLQTLFNILQIGIIVFAVLITAFRLSAQAIEGFEPDIEAWFQEQGVSTELSKFSVRVDGLRPEITIRNFEMKLASGETYKVNRARLHFDLIESLQQQRYIIDKAHFHIRQLTIDTQLLSGSDDSDNQLLETVIRSILPLKHVSLTINNLEIIDLDNKSHHFLKNKISLNGSNYKKRLQLSSSLAQQLTKAIKAQIELNFIEKESKTLALSGKGYVELNVNNLRSFKVSEKLNLSGSIGVKNWFDFNGVNGSVTSLLSANNIGFNVAGSPQVISVNSQLITDVEDNNVFFQLNNHSLRVNEQTILDNTLTGKTNFNTDALSSLLFIENIDINQANNIVKSIPQLSSLYEFSQKLKPNGLVDELFINAKNFKKLDESQVALKASQLHWQAHKGVPSVNRLDIDAVADKVSFNAATAGGSLNVLIPEIFSHPFNVDTAKATINGQIDANGLLIDIPSFVAKHNKADVNARVKLEIPYDASPYMFLRLHGKNADIQTVEPFLPQILMDEEVLQWVKQSVLEATVNNADVLYAGRLENDVNFDVKYNGIFDTTLNVDNIDLRFDPEWPIVKASNAMVQFKNYQLKVKSNEGKSNGLKAKDISFYIPNLDKPIAQLELKATSSFKRQWAYVTQSPIKYKVPYYDNVDDLKGHVASSVSVKFPLENLTYSAVEFDVNLKTDKVAFTLDKLAIEMSNISGPIKITDKNIWINPIKAKWYGQDIIVKTKNENDRLIQLNITANKFDTKHLLHNLPVDYNRHVEGHSDWTIDVDLNPYLDDSQVEMPIASIKAQSNLNGTKINLPLPFLIEKDEKKSTRLSVNIFQNDLIKAHIDVENIYEALVSLELTNDDTYQLTSANMQFGNDSVSKKLAKGIQVNGNIEELNLDHWKAYMSQDSSSKNTALDNSDTIDLINNMEVFINHLVVSGIEAKNTELNIEKTDKGLVGLVQSSVASGGFFVPIKQHVKMPIEINMDIVDVVLKEGLGKNTNDSYKTDQIPNLIFNSKKLHVNGKKFTNAHIEIVTHIDNYFGLKVLRLEHNKTVLNATGSWDYLPEEDKNQSQIMVDIKGEDFGQSLKEIGIGDSISNGSVSFNGRLFWPAEIWKLDFAQAQGSVNFSLKDGYILDAEPGGGRFVGLLSLSALPKRLTLDFSDFFKKGLQFDSIKGDFSIINGNMWTKNLKMKGTATDVLIEGRTGLKDKDYDQTITVVPQIRDTLPVLGSLISGASVGWAMLLIQKVFEDPIDESVSIKYKVSGHWDDPKIEVIEKPKPKEAEEDSFGEN